MAWRGRSASGLSPNKHRFLIILLAAAGHVSAQSNSGTEFVLVFGKNIPKKSSFPLELHVTTQSATNVTVCARPPLLPQYPAVCGVTTSGHITTLFLDTKLRMSLSGIEQKAVLVTATEPVVVYGVNKEGFSTDAFLALPTSTLGTQYAAVSAVPNYQSFDYAEINIATALNNTQVNVTVPLTVTSLTFDGVQYMSGQMISFTLQQYESAQVLSPEDISGAHVQSNQPIAVLCGNQKTAVSLPINNGKKSSSADHLVEQLAPVSTWGTNVVVIPTPHRSKGDIIKITSGDVDVNVTVTQTPPVQFSNQTVVLQPWSSIELPVVSTAAHRINASSPVQVFQLMATASVDKVNSDPSLMYIPPVEQFLNSYTFSTVDSATRPYSNYISIIIENAKLPGFTVDGVAIDLTNYTPWLDESGTLGFHLPILPGTHRLLHNDSRVTFGAFMTGHTKMESYGYPAGMRLKNLLRPAKKQATSSSDFSESSWVPLVGVGAAVLTLLVTGLTAALTGCCLCCPCCKRRRKRKEQEEENEKRRYKRHLKRLHKKAGIASISTPQW